jgi:DNA-directed RNA polymerase specialized sigma24 family protein
MARPPSGLGHDADFTEFVHAGWPGLYRTAYLLVGDRELAEDLAQTALAKTYAAWARIDDRSAAPAYARRTLVNTAASWFRKKGWRNELPSDELPELGHATDPSTRPAVLERPAPAAAAATRGRRPPLLRGPLGRRDRRRARLLDRDGQEPDLRGLRQAARAAGRCRHSRDAGSPP